MRRGLVASAALWAASSVSLSSCFIEATTAYMPSMRVRVTQGTGEPVEHTEGAFTLALNLGVFIDLFGVGLHYGFLGPTTVGGAAGLPDHWSATGGRLRGDIDLPIRFGGNFFGLRATYAYQKLSEGQAGPNGDGHDDDVPAHGTAQLGGLTLIGPTNDVGLTLGVMHVDLETEPGELMAWPAFHASGTGVALSFMVRFVPTSALLRYYVDRPGKMSEGQKLQCPNPSYSEHCTASLSGFSCTFTHGC